MLNHLNRKKLRISSISALGSYLVLYSCLIPFSNNIIEAFYPSAKTYYIPAANNNLSAVIWSLGMCVQPVIFFLASRMKPFIWSYSLPLFTSIYGTSFYFLPLLGHKPKENIWFFAAIIVIVFMLIACMYITSFYFKVMKLREKVLIKTLEEVANQD
ncbi:hypothetical protein SAMN05421866_4177 [Chryseobacterium oranimense]|uniref:Uncharacterized protein n=1 Tax=Chryseobacterium oranimense TaxID=421058 RepID=A0A1M5WQK2_9FLAO|nr:hypothetical protein [Chryseobacterium oranimense]SHH89642.1 hypothetical protein SAMN05421866_4177 [Chryseobacterium oranimense]